MKIVKNSLLLAILGVFALTIAGCGGGGGNTPIIPPLPPLIRSGALDTTFGTDGRVTTPIASSSSYDFAYDLAIQADGKFVVAGSTDWGTGPYFALARYGINGNLDPDFGGSGKVVTGFGTGNDEANSVAVRADGRIVVAGFSGSGTSQDFALAGYNPDGSLDTSFGTGGRVTTPIGLATNDGINGIAIQSDGKIVAAGYSYDGTKRNFALARYNPNGSLDTTFGAGGKLTTPIGANNDLANCIAVQADGKIIAAGYSTNGTHFDFALARYNPNGSLDATFGTGGRVTTEIGLDASDVIADIAIQTDGKIVAVGYTHTTSAGWDFALARYNTDGTLDTSFGAGGKVVTAIGTFNDYARSVAIQSDGKIIVGGQAQTAPNVDFALVRYNADGSVDTTFGTGGKVVTAFGTGATDTITSIAIQSDGKIVAAGYVYMADTYVDFALARYWP